jgi:hypothetical protein
MTITKIKKNKNTVTLKPRVAENNRKNNYVNG